MELITKTMDLNEMELSYWSLWLDELHWKDVLINCTKLLWVTGFQTKVD